MLSCHDMIRTAVVQIRVDPALRDRLARLREERHVNVSAWLRDLVEAALDREFPPDGATESTQPKHPAPVRQVLRREAPL